MRIKRFIRKLAFPRISITTCFSIQVSKRITPANTRLLQDLLALIHLRGQIPCDRSPTSLYVPAREQFFNIGEQLFSVTRILSAKFGMSHIITWLLFGNSINTGNQDNGHGREKGRGKGRGRGIGGGRGKAKTQADIPPLSFCTDGLPRIPLNLTLPTLCPNHIFYRPTPAWLLAVIIIFGEKAFDTDHRQEGVPNLLSIDVSKAVHSKTAQLTAKWMKSPGTFPDKDRATLIENLVTLWFLATSGYASTRLKERHKQAQDKFLDRVERVMKLVRTYESILQELDEWIAVSNDMLDEINHSPNEANPVDWRSAREKVPDIPASLKGQCEKEALDNSATSRQRDGYATEDLQVELTKAQRLRATASDGVEAPKAKVQAFEKFHAEFEHALNEDGLEILAGYAQQMLGNLLSPAYFTAAFLSILRLEALCRITIDDTPGRRLNDLARKMEPPTFPISKPIRPKMPLAREAMQIQINQLVDDIRYRVDAARQSSQSVMTDQQAASLKSGMWVMYLFALQNHRSCSCSGLSSHCEPFPEWPLQIADVMTDRREQLVYTMMNMSREGGLRISKELRQGSCT